MVLNLNGKPLKLEFNFAERSYNLREEVFRLLVDNKPFALYHKDRCYKIYMVAELCSTDHNKITINYNNVEAFKADLSFDCMLYDYVTDLGEQDLIEDKKLLK